LGQPRLTNPTLAGTVGSELADMFFFKGTGTMLTMISGKQIYTILASGIATSALEGAGTLGTTEGIFICIPPICIQPIRATRANLMETKNTSSILRRRDVG